MATASAPVFIIEHLEPELGQWCLFEYEQISKIVGKKHLAFTNIQKEKDFKKLRRYGFCFSESVRDIPLEPACVLDPAAFRTLVPHEVKKFRFFIFGGILGDHPPQKRTTPELTRYLPRAAVRNIGKEQMSTDNAVYVVSKIVQGIPLKKIRFVDTACIRINSVESIELPYRYPLSGKKARMNPRLVQYLKRKKTL